MKNDILYIVMPAYNEEENIEGVVQSWYPILLGKSDESRMVIADSESVDNTHNILLEMKNKYPKIEILSNTGKQHGEKLIALYKYAIASGATYVFQTDSDGQTNPNEFNFFWENRQRYDAIIGRRKVRGDGRVRKMVEQVVCFLVLLVFNVCVPDANAPFRLMSSQMLKKYIYSFDDDYNIPNIILTAYFKGMHEKVLFQEISFKPRQAGENSVNMKKIIKVGFRAIGDFVYYKRKMKGFME